MAQQDFVPDRRKRLDDLPELPEGRPTLLLSAVYSGEEKKVYLKFYDPKDNVIYHWRDRTDHKPYCYTKMEFADQAEQVAQKETKYTLEHVKKRDIILDKQIDVLKVVAPDPLSIGGTDSSFREKVTSWECYDTATEILTREGGWKSYYQLRDDEVVATYNQATRRFEWQQIEAKVDYDYNGEMYGLHAKTIDFLVTPNHRIFLWNQKGDAKCVLAKELYEEQEQLRPNYRPFPDGWSIRKSAESGFDGDTDLDRFTLRQSSWRCSEVDVPLEEFAEFLGWFIAEGGIGGRGNETYINLILSTAKDPWPHLKHMIESWGMKVWTKNNNDTHSTILIFSSKDLADWIRANCYVHRSHYKRVPAAIKNLPTGYLKIFLKSLFLGDGTLRDGDSGQLTTTSEVLADDIQEIACKCGYSVTIKQKPAMVDNRGWQFADAYKVTLSTHKTATNPDQRITKQQYVGKVWCVKVPNGIVYVRRNKKPYWCGNSDIKYHENYLYDRSLIPGLYYVRKDEQITPYEYPISEKVQFALKSLLWDKIKEAGESGKEYRQYITNWANLLNQPIPELKRVAVDIEVETEEGRMPNPRDHDRRVTAVGFVASDGFRKVLVLASNTPNTGEPLIPEAEPCQTEKELLEKAFRIINEYPIVLTFNGDDFDLPYLYARSQDSRIDPNGVAIPKEKVPIMVKKESFIKRGMQAEPVGIRHGIHIDLYRTFDNKSIQIYAFNRMYTEKTLNAICEALLGDTKIEFEGDIGELPIQRLAEYCLKDADLTFRLTSKDDNLLMKLLVVIARIGRLSVDDIARFGVNQWIRGILYYEHRQRNELIPSRSELEAKGTASTTAVIKEKKYRGGEVVEPIPGIHFNVVVLDFACFDDQTEILTKDGWKNYDTLKQGDIGLSVNLETGAVEEDPIQKIFKYDIDDIVYRIKTPRKLDFIFTPNHRMVYRTKKGGNNWIWKDRLEVKPLKEITNYHYSLPCFGKWKGKVSYYQTIGNYTFDTNTWLEFIGRFVGDGSFGTRSVQISENNNHHNKIESLCAIIKKLGFEPHVHREGSKNAVNIVIHNKQFTDALKSIFDSNLNSHNKHIPKFYMELSSEHLEYLLKGIMESDGSTSGTGEKTFATVSKQLADDFQLLALKCGYNCVITSRISNGFGRKYPYYLCVLSGFRHKKASFVVSRQNPDQVSKEHYKGRVWCASTRNTTLIIRRKGRVIVTGNSLYPSIIKVHNLSYETINCPHDTCRETKIEGTTHWVCKQKKGLTSLLIGSLRDLRVNYYKHLAKDKSLPPQERQLYYVISQAVKVILNASYGVLGFESFPLYCLPVADAITAIGRSTIHKAIDKCKEIGIEVVYSDSVLPDTPIIIRRKDRSMDIIPIESLMPKTVSATRYDKFGDLEVLTESGFSALKYIYRHKVKKKGYRILTRKGFVECTEDHSLVINNKEVRPADLKIGDSINQVPFKTESRLAINPDLAWLFGFFIAEGTCGVYHYKKTSASQVKYSWRIVNQDEEKLRKAQTIIQQCLGFETTIIDIRESSATYGLVPKNETKILVDYFRLMCYRSSYKAVPHCVLNAHIEAKKAFIEGLIAGDGSMDRNGIVSLDQIHKTVISGVVSILEQLEIEYSLDRREDKSNVCRLRVIRDGTDTRIKPADVIRKIETFDIDGYVYDLETENHHFCGGVGNILLHNTDSLFLKNPSPTAVDEVAAWARNTLGVDLEVDKEYRYVVFSDLKKNYLGVKSDGAVDVKGLTGKKSHTPPFIRKAFYDILAILGRVNSEKDFESAKENIKNVILENAKSLEARKIPLEDLSFNVTINKSLSTYGKKTGSKTMDGKSTDTYKGLPQHIKAAKMLADKGRELRAGDVISYVKIKNGEGVKPVELASPEEIDTEKYLEAMESTFEQVLSALNFDFKSVLGKPRQQSLDELFWSKPAS